MGSVQVLRLLGFGWMAPRTRVRREDARCGNGRGRVSVWLLKLGGQVGCVGVVVVLWAASVDPSDRSTLVAFGRCLVCGVHVHSRVSILAHRHACLAITA